VSLEKAHDRRQGKADLNAKAAFMDNLCRNTISADAMFIQQPAQVDNGAVRGRIRQSSSDGGIAGWVLKDESSIIY
jgi:hypothetical protein